MNSCTHSGLYWYAAPANEQGWRCADCGWKPGEPPGYSPEHDRSHLRVKVSCVVHDLHEAAIIYVSNGDCGEGLADLVTARCIRRNLYDSVSIARVVLECEGDRQHAKFWRYRSEAILAGRDTRQRCACGQLAVVWQGGPNGGTHACSWEHLDAVRGQSTGGPF